MMRCRGVCLALLVAVARPLQLENRRSFALRAAAAAATSPTLAARAAAPDATRPPLDATRPPLDPAAKPPIDPSMLDVAVQLGDLRLSRPYEVRSQMLVPTCVEMARSCRIVASSSTPSTRRLLDGVVMPDPHRSTEPGRPRHRREMT
jgi:hypothetical protein